MTPIQRALAERHRRRTAARRNVLEWFKVFPHAREYQRLAQLARKHQKTLATAGTK